MARNPKRSKNAGKQTAARTKGKHRKETGIDNAMAYFFLGGESMIAGRMHYKPPRWTEEYERMRVVDLFRRINDDLEELLARAYPTWNDEWRQQFAPNGWNFAVTYEHRLRALIHEGVAESLCPGLMARIRSPSKSKKTRALAEYNRLVGQLLASEPRHAADALAFITKKMATYLENLFVKRSALMTEVAVKYDLWPVNLGIRDKKVKGVTRRELQRLEFARDYLIELGINLRPHFPSGHKSGAEQRISPFKLAAKELYGKMLMLKDDPERHVWFPTVTRWAKRLFALAEPMTKSNSSEWWSVAKDYLYERWDKAQREFEPLIKHLGFSYPIEVSNEMPYESMFKSRVIDNSLKEAFITLARPDL